jgi:hypothetical protein
MINVITSEIQGAYTNGFGVSTEGLAVVFEKGSITFTRDANEDGVISATELERYSFPSFTFEIVPDAELPVLYDIYLCGDNSIEVERHEMLPDTIPYYTGSKDLLHLLGTIEVPAGITSLEDAKVNLRLLNMVVGLNA